jgi:hypothetical protein
MRFLIELGLVGAFVGMTWNQSLQSRYNDLTGAPKPPSQGQYMSMQKPGSTGQWMWDPHHHSILDRPAVQSTQTVQQDKH